MYRMMAENVEDLRHRIAKMQEFFAEQTKQIEGYNEYLVRRMIEKVKVIAEFKYSRSVDLER